MRAAVQRTANEQDFQILQVLQRFLKNILFNNQESNCPFFLVIDRTKEYVDNFTHIGYSYPYSR
jgi:hypothetical protein